MKRNYFEQFSRLLREDLVNHPDATPFVLAYDERYTIQYIPFEYVNKAARLVLVGITPGKNQLDLAYSKAHTLLAAGRAADDVLKEVKKAASFGGDAMRPNLLRMLRHFRFAELLGIPSEDSLWSGNAHLLHSTSVVPHAAFKNGKMFAGSFDEVLKSNVLRECFEDCFVPSVREIGDDALYVGLGPTPHAALEWCVEHGMLARRQVLGAFAHPSTSSGSQVNYYLREKRREDFTPGDPVLHRCAWLDTAYAQMHESVDRIRASGA